MRHFKLRDYQEEISIKGVDILKKYNIVYLAMEVRTGKSLTALNIVNLSGLKNCLFLTKKKAIKSIEDDFKMSGFNFNLTVINDESLHKVNGTFDIVIHDEHHRFGALPKPNKTAKLFKDKFSHLPMIFLSGTPTPENYSQIYHQFWVSEYSPFRAYKNFYNWANEFVIKSVKYVGHEVIDYTNAKIDIIKPIIDKYMIYFTQNEAGFTTEITENILKFDVKQNTKDIIKKLQKDRVIELQEGVILADTNVKLMQKCHQLWSGSCLTENGKVLIFDYSKAEFIKEKFIFNKIAIFYKFKGELDILKNVFGDRLTTDLEEFNNTGKNIALQIISGREGISLKKAEFLIYYNIDFSALSYWQSRNRMSTKDRLENNIYWIFANGGIEEKIYKCVMNKKDYTLKHFEYDIRTENTEANNRLLPQARLFDDQDNKDKYERLPRSFNTEGW